MQSYSNGNLYTDFADQHRNDARQYQQQQLHQGAGLNDGCPTIDHCKPSCAPMFFCPDSTCPRGHVRAAGGNCLPNDFDTSKMVKATPATVTTQPQKPA
jgi:hypothetical protein